jgi:two-component system sensor histidine kinase AtoS
MRPMLGRPRLPAFGFLFLAILAVVTTAELILGLAVYRRLRTDLEADLGRRLVRVSQVLAQNVDASLVAQFDAGDETLLAYQIVQRRFSEQARAAGVDRASVVDGDLRALLDSRPDTPLRSVRHALLASRVEIARAQAGSPRATSLYRNEEGALRLSAIAAVQRGGRPSGLLVVVDAAPEFFASLAALRRQMMVLGAAGVLLAGIASLAMLQQVGRRLNRLRAAVSRASRGELTARAEVAGSDAIGALGRDLDGLIASIVARRDYTEAILSSLDVGLVTVHADGKIRAANASARRIIGSTAPDLLGQPLAEVLRHEPALATFAASALGGEGLPASAEIALRGGLAAGGRVVAVNASRLTQAGEPAGLILTLLDVTELRWHERRARANERLAGLGSLAGGLLHELRNPLASLTVYLDLLRAEEMGGEGREILDRSIDQGERLTALLEDFQVSAGLRPLRREWVRIDEVVASAVAKLAWPANVTCTVDQARAALWHADRRLLEHALVNLLRNAIEAFGTREGRVSVTTGLEEGGVLRVSDDGPGIHGEGLERIFDPLYTTKPHGSGMGLAIVERIVTLHGGQIEVTAGREAGATFTIRMGADDAREGS